MDVFIFSPSFSTLKKHCGNCVDGERLADCLFVVQFFSRLVFAGVGPQAGVAARLAFIHYYFVGRPATRAKKKNKPSVYTDRLAPVMWEGWEKNRLQVRLASTQPIREHLLVVAYDGEEEVGWRAGPLLSISSGSWHRRWLRNSRLLSLVSRFFFSLRVLVVVRLLASSLFMEKSMWNCVRVLIYDSSINFSSQKKKIPNGTRFVSWLDTMRSHWTLRSKTPHNNTKFVFFLLRSIHACPPP